MFLFMNLKMTTEQEAKDKSYEILRAELEGDGMRGFIRDNLRDNEDLFFEECNGNVLKILSTITYFKKDPVKYGEAYVKWAREQNKKIRKEKEEMKEEEKNNEDLKTFIFDEDEIIKKRVFTSHLINGDLFGFGILLPRMEDIINKKGEVMGQEQKWRPVIITSNKGGLAVSKFFQNSYKRNSSDILGQFYHYVPQ